MHFKTTSRIEWGTEYCDTEIEHHCRFDNGKLVFKPSEFVPGFWCGTEGLRILINGKVYKVTAVDLQNREISVKTVLELLEGK